MTPERRPPLTWVFLDVGNVLLDEAPLTYHAFARHAEAVARARPGVTFGELLARREARALAGSRWPTYEAVAPYLTEAECAAVWEATAREVRAGFAALAPLIPGAAEAVRALRARGLRLGLIANQGRECRERLRELGLLREFDVVALSEEVGAYKPDPALFRFALGSAGVEPGACLMVGDRPDNDLAPAAALGMATAWVRWPDRAAKGVWAASAEARAYLDSLDRAAAAVSGPSPPPVTLRLETTAQLPGALGAWRQGDKG